MVKFVKLMVTFRGEKKTSPVIALALLLAARQGPDSCAAAERVRARTVTDAARSSERRRID